MIAPGPVNEPENKLIVLLVEDSEDDAYFFKRALRKAAVACKVDHVPNGAKAIEHLERSPQLPHLIFLDLKMPVVSGFDVLQWIRTAKLVGPKVFVLSGSNDNLDRARARELGAADYLVKPITAGELKARVESI